MSDILLNANTAATERLWSHAVGITNHALVTRGTDPESGMPGQDESAPGTGVAGIWGKHHFILTAKHVLDKAQITDLRFFVRQKGGLKTQYASQVTMRDAVEPMPLNDKGAVIHRCAWEDLALVTMKPNALGSMLEFFDVANSWVDPPKNETVVGVGYPVSFGVSLFEKQVGAVFHKAKVLSPIPFNGTVQGRPSRDDMKFKFTSFDLRRHFLIPFDHAKDGKRPEGISGAAVWVLSEEKRIVWAARFKFAGICTSCYSKGTVEQVLRASIVRRFLTEVLGPSKRTVSSPRRKPTTTYARTKRWRAKHPEVKAAERLRYYRQFQKNNKRKWSRWTEEEDKQITARNAPPDSKLSARLGRSVQAIQQRRSALNATS